MRILIADDHELVRDTISAFLEKEADISVDQAASFNEASEMIDDKGPYDLVLLDVTMPGMDGLASMQKAIDANEDNPVGLISGTANRETAKQAIDSGAAGFLPKSMAAKSLIHAVRFMAAGEQYAPINFMTAQVEDPPHPLSDQLSDREMQVLDGLCRGLANKEIARELELQEVTIKLHVKTLTRKLNARNRTQAAIIAKDAGLF